jgi:hypothetical protein
MGKTSFFLALEYCAMSFSKFASFTVDTPRQGREIKICCSTAIKSLYSFVNLSADVPTLSFHATAFPLHCRIEIYSFKKIDIKKLGGFSGPLILRESIRYRGLVRHHPACDASPPEVRCRHPRARTRVQQQDGRPTRFGLDCN